MSQQKHAAREYHRKAKLERLAKLNVLSNRQARGTSVPAPESPSNLSSRPLPPRNRSFLDDQDYTKSFAVFDAGTGQLDPFNACVPSGMPSYVLDMLDYGKLPNTFLFPGSLLPGFLSAVSTTSFLIKMHRVVQPLRPTFHFVSHITLL